MWVKSERVIHLRDPYTDFSMDFDSRMVKEGVPLEVPDNDFLAEHIKTRDNGRPLVVVRDDIAKKQSEQYWAKVEKEKAEVEAKRNELLNAGTVVAHEQAKELAVPKVQKPETPPEPEPETETKSNKK